MNLFTKYQNLLTIAFAIVIVISISLLGLQGRTAYHHELKIFQDSFAESAINLDSIVKSVTDHLHILQETAEDHINAPSDMGNSRYLQNVRSQIIEENEAYYHLVPNSTQHREQVGNLSGLGTFSQLQADQLFQQELNMAFLLNPLFKVTTQNIPDITWTYYTSAQHFINLYPYDAHVQFEEAILDAPFFVNGTPENNPQRDYFWTPAYLDLAGKGLMVTAGVPVYQKARFLGTVSVDLTLDILSRFIQNFSYPQGTLLIVGEDHQLLAHPRLITAEDREIKTLEMALPQKLMPEIDAILQQPNGEVIHYQSFGIIHQYLEQPHWHLISFVPDRAIYKTIFQDSLLALFIPLLGLGICLIFTSRILKTIFVQPACQLTEHISNETQGTVESIPDNLPELWQPWFQTISTNFDEKRQLLRELEVQIETLKSTQLQLVQSEKMSSLGNLVSGIAHEINNPTGFLMGNIKPAQGYVADLFELIDLYQKKLPNPDAELEDAIEDIDLDFIRDDLPKLLSSMTLGVERIRDISRSLRVFSRRDQERQSLFDIHSGLDSTLLILKHRTKALPNRPAIAIVKEYGDIPPINCFVGQLNQVFINILANAIDAFDAVNQHRSYAEIEANPNQITIRTIAIDAQHLQIEIQDNGSGMDAETQNRIFEQGFTTKLAGQGTGLGMAIAHQIITEKHNGTLTCTSELGRGTLFTITLPHTSQPQ